jgi:diguanylate cyclase (GGDEF)-like protein/putative nucleotidyltransferase with HDIG domain
VSKPGVRLEASQTMSKPALGLPLRATLHGRLRRFPGFGPRIGLPVSQDPILQARSIAAFFMAGSALGAISLLLPAPADRRDTALLLSVILSGGTGAVYYAFPKRLPSLVIRAQPFLGYTFIAFCIWAGGSELATAYGVYVFWPPVVFVYLFELRRAAWQLAYGLTLCTAAFLLGSDPYPEVQILMFVGASLMLALLVSAVHRRLEELLKAEANAARTDLLTGLPNNRGFEDQLAASLESAARDNDDFSLILAQLDGFDLLNDRLGRHRGDEALKRVAAIATGALPGARLSRLGGTEFAAILPGVDADSGIQVAERLRRAVGQEFAQDLVPLTMSCGVVAYPRHGRDRPSLMRWADEAVSAAKKEGGNRSTLHRAHTIAALHSPSMSKSDLDPEPPTLSTVLSLVEVLDMRHTSTAEHSITVGRYSYQIAVALGLPPEKVDRLRLAGILHDIGKIGIADAILLKEDELGVEEYSEIQRHSELGARVLANAGLPDIAEWVLAHHERPDGAGYPEGLVGDSIPFEARVLAVADSYEAMVAERVYSAAMRRQQAIDELRRGSGTQFDPEIVEAFLSTVSTTPVTA